MLKQEDLAFLKAISAVRQSPALLREPRKALVASKEKRAVALCKAGGSARAPTRRQIKKKASQLGTDSSGEPATRRPAPDLASGSSSSAFTSTEGQVAQSSQEPQRPEYAAVAAGRAALSLSGPLKPTVMESDESDSAASSEAANRRMSQDMSGPLSGTPAAPVPQRTNRTRSLHHWSHRHSRLPRLVTVTVPQGSYRPDERRKPDGGAGNG
jgi:hypothetical protein